MRNFAAALTALLVIAFVAPQPVQAITAWSGSNCDGDQGNSVPCDGSCHSFDTRHSFRVTEGGTHCVTMFEGTGCPNGRGDQIFMHTFAGETGQCQNVNTGTAIRSFLCSPDNTCLV